MPYPIAPPISRTAFLALFLLLTCCPGSTQAGDLADEMQRSWIVPGSLEDLQQTWSRLSSGSAEREASLVSPFQPLPLIESARGFDFLAVASTRYRGNQAMGPFDQEIPFAPLDLNESNLRWQVEAGVHARLTEHWSLWQRTRIDSDPCRDPASRTKQYRQIDASVEVPDAVLNYRGPQFDFWLGRTQERWGPGWTGSLILEPGAAPADGFGGAVVRKRWALRYRMGRLDDGLNEDGHHSRYLAAHRLDLRPLDSLRIGLSEAALVSSRGATPLWLLNPVLPWSLAQSEHRDAQEGVNILWAVDGAWNVGRHWTVYGQFLLDDFMLDSADRRTHPDQLAWLTGFLWSSADEPGRNASWQSGFEFTRLGNWSYVHRNPLLRYQAWGASMGHAAGPGSEAATAFVSFSDAERLGTALLWLRWHRQGRTWLGTSESPVGSADLSWPADPVSRWRQWGLVWKSPSLRGADLTLRGGWTDADIGDIDSYDPAAIDPRTLEPARGFWTSATLEIPMPRLSFDH